MAKVVSLIFVLVGNVCILYWMWVQMKINKLTGERLDRLEKKATR